MSRGRCRVWPSSRASLTPLLRLEHHLLLLCMLIGALTVPSILLLGSGHRCAIVLIAPHATLHVMMVLQSGHHLSICVVERMLKLRVVVLFPTVLDIDSHPLDFILLRRLGSYQRVRPLV